MYKHTKVQYETQTLQILKLSVKFLTYVGYQHIAKATMTLFILK